MTPATRKRVAIGLLAVIFATLLISWCARPVRGEELSGRNYGDWGLGTGDSALRHARAGVAGTEN